jgi:hypothetical protein
MRFPTALFIIPIIITITLLLHYKQHHVQKACNRSYHVGKPAIHGTASFPAKPAAVMRQIFEGKTVFPLDDKDPFAGKRLIMHVSSCKSNEIRIPFHVGEDRSRTWMLTTDANGLLLKHDHRHADGTPDSVTMYGGYANTAGNAGTAVFPGRRLHCEADPGCSY